MIDGKCKRNTNDRTIDRWPHLRSQTPPNDRNRHSATFDNQQIGCNFQSVRFRQVMCIEHQ
jgi:hypothetical protein